MLRVGLTGGLASGKSMVAEMFAERGARVIHADQLAHDLMRPGTKIYEQIVERFGSDILESDGSINRPRLAQKVFAGGRVRELNQIVHPAVIAEQERLMVEIGRADPSAVAMVEAALIFEAGVTSHFDKIVVVACGDEPQRIQRFAQRHCVPEALAAKEVGLRMAAQMPEVEKIKQADYVVNNSGTRAQTAAQVDKIYSELKKQSAARSQRSEVRGQKPAKT